MLLYSKSLEIHVLWMLPKGMISFSKLYILKSDSQPPKKNCFICFNESPLKMMKNVFSFYLKSSFRAQDIWIFVLNFGHVEKTAWLEL